MGNMITDAFYSLGRNINKLGGKATNETEQGVVSVRFPELTLDMDNKDLLDLTKKWNKTWIESDVYGKWVGKMTENENYWKGFQFQRPDVDKTRALVDNVIFESLETYLPQITRRNPEPSVAVDADDDVNDDVKQQFASKLQKDLAKIADELSLRLKLKKAGRHWAIYLLGAAKLGWDMNRNIPTVKIIRPKKLILDPEATVDEDGYTGKFIGEHRKQQASLLIDTLKNIDAEKDAVKVIEDLAKGDLGTEIGFIEWWTDEYMCWTIGDGDNGHVLLKAKNPHWNYDQTMEQPAMPAMPQLPVQEGQIAPSESGEPAAEQLSDSNLMNNEQGEQAAPVPPQTIPGFNHLPVPSKPYRLLSVFNLGTQPVDDTSLIGQNLSNQDIINKRLKQIDKNADSMNGGMVVSGARSGLTKEQAKGVTEALKKGGTVFIPDGAPGDAVMRTTANPLPGDVFNQLVDLRNRTRDIFGTSGSTPAAIQHERTVRGKMINQQLDTDRIGGGISEYLEQLADDIYNWFVQLLYVYDDKYSQMQNKPKVDVSVKEGSLLPKDSTTIANQAVQLATEGKMSLLDLYKRLDYSNAEELAANVWLEANAPEILYGKDPRVAQAIQMKQQAVQAAAGAGAATQAKPPSESISFKDLPPDGKVQMAAKAGIQLHAEAIAAHDEHVAQRSTPPQQPTAPMPLPMQ